MTDNAAGDAGQPPLVPHLEDDLAAELAADHQLAAEQGPRGRLRLADFNAHEWSVLLPLALVGFFINYDNGLLTLANKPIAEGLGVSIATFGIGIAAIRLAALGSVFTLRLADRWGRRRLLLLSVLAFTIATGFTVLAWSLIAFVAFQMVARLFLATEETLGGVVLTEELRPDRRGAGIGLLGTIATAGFGLVAVMLPLVHRTSLGWRLFYLVALIPLFVTAYLRRNLKETQAFAVAAAKGRVQSSFWPQIPTEHRANFRRISMLLGMMGLLDTTAFFYAAALAQETYQWSEDLFSLVVLAAGPATFAGYYAGGRLTDRVGRKRVIGGSMLSFSLGCLLVFSEEPALYAIGFFIMTGSNAATQSARASYLSELFPTEVRATLAAFVGANIVAAGSLGLLLVGVLQSVVSTSAAVMALAVLGAVATLLLRNLPETAGTDIINA